MQEPASSILASAYPNVPEKNVTNSRQESHQHLSKQLQGLSQAAPQSGPEKQPRQAVTQETPPKHSQPNALANNKQTQIEVLTRFCTF